ncbi:LIM domain-containing protein PLIM2b-like [Gossypium australe]|uniref:LIM domain-containing protein PLIM2b-like n=1 Tax=Gossypium australe TaxID=47621 RepID=A0A5B6UXC4_9ROSI|nr:LIM domain-containing protein PLIM2b-like [Gossypium australe]
MMTLEGVPYHKTCFKCSHCKGNLQMTTYSWMDGILYCKPHFEQLFKESGNFSKNFQTGSTTLSIDYLSFILYIYAKNLLPSLFTYLFNMLQNRTPSKLSSLFSGTLDKCAACEKTVYPLEKVTMEGECFHKTCFRCAHGGCPLTHSSYAALDGVLYCKHHFAQLFMVKGNYNHVLQAATHRRNISTASSSENVETRAEPEESAADEESKEASDN